MTSGRIADLYREARETPRPGGFCSALLDELDVALDLPADSRERIPATGPLVVVSNHPFGLLDGLLLLEVLGSARPDAKILANALLGMIPEIAERSFLVDPYPSAAGKARNFGVMRGAMEWVARGGALAVFPAGEVARFRLRSLDAPELPWNEHAARIARRAGATVLPVRFQGGNSPLFHGLGLIHPRLASLALPGELLNKRGGRFVVAIGDPIPPRRFDRMTDCSQATSYLRLRTDLLAAPSGGAVGRKPRAKRPRAASPLAGAVPAEELAREMATLPDSTLLGSLGGLEVRCAPSTGIPGILREIGRLRELTFRGAGEGTGRALDIDRFDGDYLHLFLWNPARREIAGAYRLGPTDELRLASSRGRLYTETLFDFRPSLLERLTPGLELGRSFVRPEMQRSPTALMLLWKGIGELVVRRPWYRFLFGPVSISGDYRPESRALIGAFLEQRHRTPDVARLVRPRHPYRIDRRARERLHGLGPLGTVEDISALISEIEPDGKGVPVLLRQYLKLGGEVLALSVDPGFADVVDGLILVDLAKTPRRVLERYMGAAGAASFLGYHAARTTAEAPGKSRLRHPLLSVLQQRFARMPASEPSR
jgi:putative hemolysin